MVNTLKLPVGIDDFKKLRQSDFYYIDKTRLIEQLLQNWGEVNLFTRPRRFGKTLKKRIQRRVKTENPESGLVIEVKYSDIMNGL